MGKPTRPVVLDRRWDVRSLLAGSFRIFWRHMGLFVPITAIVAVPYVVAVDLLRGKEGATDFDSPSFIVPAVLFSTVVPALITALHVVAVLRLADGERLSVREALSLARERARAAVGATLLYFVAVGFGLLALVLPGVWLSVRLFFGAQAAVVDAMEPVEALRRSSDLVRNRWWLTLGRLLFAAIVFALATLPLTILLDRLDFGVVYVAVDVLLNTIVLSLTALFATLVFMDYRGPGRHLPPRPPEPFG